MKLCLYGAGNTGKYFLDKAVNLYKGEYTEIYFADSNKALTGKMVNGYRIKDINVIDNDTKVIITSVFWYEIYTFCCLNGFNVLGVYIKETNTVYTYREMCMQKKYTYNNDQYIRYLDEKSRKVDTGVEKFQRTGNLFENISEVAIMLSNLCNYAVSHKLCPASCVQEKEIMPSKMVYKILDELRDNKFDGTICFHIYNEPLIDPRLFLFIQYIKKNLVNARVEVYSNGYYLNEQMVLELQDIGADILIVTGYGEKEYLRLVDLPVKIAYSVLFGNLDQRISMYDGRDSTISDNPCKTYFSQVSIYSNGDIGTCCLDYRHSYGLANIFETTLEASLNNEKIINMQKELLSGNRTIFPLCKNCNWVR